ncbi:MAG: fibronectin type III domain-containing protein [Candidatus Hermodarchaeota archaeon]
MKGRNKAILIIISLILILPCFASSKANPDVITTQNQNPILYVHAAVKSKEDFYLMRTRFKANGWPETYLYAYDFDVAISSGYAGCVAWANVIKERVDEILVETGAEKIDLIGHSLGGMSNRYYIKFLGGIDRVDDYVCLGSPTFCDQMTNDPDYNEGDATPGGILNDTLGDRFDPVSGVIYNGTHIPGNISYTSIYGNLKLGGLPSDGVVSTRACILDGANNIEVEGVGHWQLYTDLYVYTLVRTAVDDFNTTFLPKPPVLWAVAGDGQVELEWQPSVDDGGTPITEYKIYRAASSGGPYSLIGSPITLSYIDLTVTNGETYYYVVTAVNSQGESDYSSEVSATPQLSTSTTTTSTPGWHILFLLLSLFTLTQFRQLKKRL